jgi:hypothetical protein
VDFTNETADSAIRRLGFGYAIDWVLSKPTGYRGKRFTSRARAWRQRNPRRWLPTVTFTKAHATSPSTS